MIRSHLTNTCSGVLAKATTLLECERDHILWALNATRWVVGGPNGAAAMLGVKRTTLIWKMQKLGIARKMKPAPQFALTHPGFAHRLEQFL
jgi:formate hydrogenlyase transcriptional activator